MASTSGNGSMKFPGKPPLAPKHIKARSKLAGSGLQALTLALLAAVVLAPELNVSLVAPLWQRSLQAPWPGLRSCSPSSCWAISHPPARNPTMVDLLGNLLVFVASAGVAAGLGYAAWRTISRHQ